MAHQHRSIAAVCRCGETTIALTSEPIESITCYCESCRTAALGFERDFDAPRTVRPDGGVDYCLYRKDRVTIGRGAQQLREFRLRPQAPTRRVVSSCCGSPMFLDFTPGHWLSVYRDRLSSAPAPRLGIMTKDRLDGVELSTAIPTYKTQPPRLVFKLLAAWVAMGFRRPKIAW